MKQFLQCRKKKKNRLRLVIRFFLLSYFENCQNWLRILINDRYLSIITKFEKKEKEILASIICKKKILIPATYLFKHVTNSLRLPLQCFCCSLSACATTFHLLLKFKSSRMIEHRPNPFSLLSSQCEIVCMSYPRANCIFHG